MKSPPSILDQKPESFWNMLGVCDDWWKYWFPRGGGETAYASRRSWWDGYR